MTRIRTETANEGQPGVTDSLVRLLCRPLAWAALMSVLLNLLLLAPTLYMLQVFDRVLPSGSGSTLAALVVGVIFMTLLGFVLDVLRARMLSLSGRMAGAVLAPAVTQRLVLQVAQPGAKADTQGLRDVAAVQALFSSVGVTALFDAPWLLAYVALIAAIDWRLGAAATGFACTMLTLAWISHRLLRHLSQRLQDQSHKATQHLQNTLNIAESVVAMGMVDAVLTRWRVLSDDVQPLQQSLERLSAVLSGFARMLRQFVQVGMLAVGAWLVITGTGSAGLMIGATILLGRALVPVEQLVSGWRTIAEGAVSWRRLDALLRAPPVAAWVVELPRPAGRLIAADVNLRLPSSARPILEQISLEISAGSSMAIIGPSGAGKSSLLRVLAGIWSPSSGEVRLDEASLSQWHGGQLGRWVGYLAQDVQLFDGTVAENIARLQPQDSESILRAASRAGAHTAILDLPGGYEAQVSSGGVSPGQRQRIGLARALYGNPSLVLLDEPNANLDGAGELALGEALRALRGQVTVVVVTHRKTLLKHVDKILVLEAGRMVHFGPAAEVLQRLQGHPVAEAGATPRIAAVRHWGNPSPPGA